MAWAKTSRSWVAEWLFSRFRWYRRWCGGHWEQWWNDATCSLMWFQMDGCSKPTDYRPPCCMGSPTCEDASWPRGWTAEDEAARVKSNADHCENMRLIQEMSATFAALNALPVVDPSLDLLTSLYGTHV